MSSRLRCVRRRTSGSAAMGVRSCTDDHRLTAGEPVGGGYHLICDAARCVASTAKYDEFAGWPSLSEFPGCANRSADVELAVDQRAGDIGELLGVVEQLVVCQPRGVAEVVRDDPGKCQPKSGVVVTWVRFAAGLD